MVKEIKSEDEFHEAIKNGTVAVDFTATWCGPCKMIVCVCFFFFKYYIKK